jgi:FtsP/CotA-like multicopper oxidase with cupredoxin domain
MPRVLKRAAALATGLIALAVVGWIGLLWYESRLPDTYSVMDYGVVDYGEGPVPDEAIGGEHEHFHGSQSIADLRGPDGEAAARFILTASQGHVRLASGRTIQALTFNRRSPGPALRVRQGDLVEVVLRNDDVDGGVTLHWHGVDVPNAEDGVAGVTQDAVLPGESHTYRFRAEQIGTFWYHTHQASSKEVRRGLFGAFVIEPRTGVPHGALDLAIVAHTFEGQPVLNDSDQLEHRQVAPGTPVRLRLVNSDNTPRRFALSGTPFRVLALDGSDLHGPSPLAGVAIEVAAGGRADLGFTMPSSPVRLSLENAAAGLALSADGRGELPAETPDETFDPLRYGRAVRTPFDASSSFDRRFELRIGRKPGFLDGRPGLQWTIDGRIYPDIRTFVVEEGDLVELTVANETKTVHPMHLHGHHVLVLGRDGVRASGSPWWSDTLNVKPGQEYTVAFRADNPGIWMDHCHNLRHAADGLTLHVAYAGLSTPFSIGDDAHNRPE